MREVKAAMYTAMTGDPTLMARLGGTAPFLGRLPKGLFDAAHNRTTAAITFDADTAVDGGPKETVTVTVSVWALGHDLTESVSEDLDRLFHAPNRRQWRSLAITGGGQAFIRREFTTGIPDAASELWHKSIRFRVILARP